MSWKNHKNGKGYGMDKTTGLPTTVKQALVALLACAAMLPLLGAEYQMGAKAGRPPAGNHVFAVADQAKPTTLVENGAANAEIWIPDNSTPVVKFAARELAETLQAATGAKFDVVSKRSGNRPAILLGSNVWSKTLAKMDPATFPRDAFTIKTCGDVIVIMGNDDPADDPTKLLASWQPEYERGTLFGVYDFLERFVGARFYFPGKAGTVIPKTKTLKIPSVYVFETPDNQVRKNAFYAGRWIDEAMAEAWKPAKGKMSMLNLLALRWRFQTMDVPCCHSLANCALKERFADTHPEYFSLRGDGKRDIVPLEHGHSGHVCFSNAAFKNEIYLDAEAFLTGKPAEVRNPVPGKGLKYWTRTSFAPGYFNIMPQDGLGPFEQCHCPECAKLVKDKKETDLVWNFIINVAERLKANGVPGQVTAAAYGVTKDLPIRDIPDNVLIQVATKGPWAEGNPKKIDKENGIIAGWCDKVGDRKVYLWNYACDFPQGTIPAGVPPLCPRWTGKYYKDLVENISGAFLEDEQDYWLFRYLNNYVFYRVSWDTNTNVDALLKEHHEKMFGPGAAPMGRFFDRLEELWTTKGIKKAKDTPLGPVTTLVPINVVWEENYSDKVMEELAGYLSQAEKLCANDADSLERVKFMKDKFFGEMLAVRKKYMAVKREIEDLSFEAHRAAEPVTLDGSLDDKAWQTAPAVSLVPYNPDVEAAALKTSVKAVWTPEKLFLAFDCEEPAPQGDLILDAKSGSPDLFKDSCVELFLTLQRKSGDNKFYQMLVNAAGENSAAEVTLDTDCASTYGWKWRSGVESKAKIMAGKWTAEMSVPLAQFLKGKAKSGDVLIVNFARERNVRNPDGKFFNLYCWSPFAKATFSELCKFGSLILVEKVSDKKPTVSNGSFERWKAGLPEGWGLWDLKKCGTAAKDASRFIDGFASAKLSSSEPTRITLSQIIKLEPGRGYRLSFFLGRRTSKAQGVEPAPRSLSPTS